MIKRIVYLILLIGFISCSTTAPYQFLQNGDLIFVESNEQNLSGAISRVTKDNAMPISYDHMGIVEKKGNYIYVLHATTQGGSKKESLNNFIASQGDTRLAVYRLKKEYRYAIPAALENANAMLGKPYNYLYIPNDSSYYCSDFIQRAFKEYHIFKLEPMTFINPETGEIDSYWQQFYDKHKKPVPEGLPGCNPNGLSKSHKIDLIKLL